MTTYYGTRAGRRIVDLPTIGIDGGGTGATTAAAAFDGIKQSATDTYTGVVELATTAEVVTGTDTSRAVTAAGVTAFAQTWGHAPDVIVEDQQTSGTPAGASTAGAFETRPLNTLVRNVGTLASLASNQVTLPAGTYYIEASAPLYQSAGGKLKLRNVTDSTDAFFGDSGAAPVGVISTTTLLGCGVVTIAAAKAFSIQVRVATTKTVDGWGPAVSFGTETYARMKVWKIVS